MRVTEVLPDEFIPETAQPVKPAQAEGFDQWLSAIKEKCAAQGMMLTGSVETHKAFHKAGVTVGFMARMRGKAMEAEPVASLEPKAPFVIDFHKSVVVSHEQFQEMARELNGGVELETEPLIYAPFEDEGRIMAYRLGAIDAAEGYDLNEAQRFPTGNTDGRSVAYRQGVQDSLEASDFSREMSFVTGIVLSMNNMGKYQSLITAVRSNHFRFGSTDRSTIEVLNLLESPQADALCRERLNAFSISVVQWLIEGGEMPRLGARQKELAQLFASTMNWSRHYGWDYPDPDLSLEEAMMEAMMDDGDRDEDGEDDMDDLGDGNIDTEPEPFWGPLPAAPGEVEL